MSMQGLPGIKGSFYFQALLYSFLSFGSVILASPMSTLQLQHNSIQQSVTRSLSSVRYLEAKRHADTGNFATAFAEVLGSCDVAAARTPSDGLRHVAALKSLFELTLNQFFNSWMARSHVSADSQNNTMQERMLMELAKELRMLVDLYPPGDRNIVTIGYHALSLVMLSSLPSHVVSAAFETIENYTHMAHAHFGQEGFSPLTQAWWLGRQAAGATIRKICEIGFNAGHSALAMMLSAPRSTTMVSFDFADKPYSDAAMRFMYGAFPRRFKLIRGPSNGTVPVYARQHVWSPRCDLIFVDGGHHPEDAGGDLFAMSSLATPGRTLVVVDDVGCSSHHCKGPSLVWKHFKRVGRVQELGCEEDLEHQWCWGVYA